MPDFLPGESGFFIAPMNPSTRQRIQAALVQWNGDTKAVADSLGISHEEVLKVEPITEPTSSPFRVAAPLTLHEQYRQELLDPNPNLVSEVRDQALNEVLARLEKMTDKQLVPLVGTLLKHEVALKAVAKPSAAVNINNTDNRQVIMNNLAARLETQLDPEEIREIVGIPKARLISPEVIEYDDIE